MTEQFSPFAVFDSAAHAEDPQGRNAHLLIDWCFHEGSLLSVYVFDSLAAGKRHLVRSHSQYGAIFLVPSMQDRRPVSTDVDELQIAGADAR